MRVCDLDAFQSYISAFWTYCKGCSHNDVSEHLQDEECAVRSCDTGHGARIIRDLLALCLVTHEQQLLSEQQFVPSLSCEDLLTTLCDGMGMKFTWSFS